MIEVNLAIIQLINLSKKLHKSLLLHILSFAKVIEINHAILILVEPIEHLAKFILLQEHISLRKSRLELREVDHAIVVDVGYLKDPLRFLLAILLPVQFVHVTQNVFVLQQTIAVSVQLGKELLQSLLFFLGYQL